MEVTRLLPLRYCRLDVHDTMNTDDPLYKTLTHAELTASYGTPQNLDTISITTQRRFPQRSLRRRRHRHIYRTSHRSEYF
jgi:hypothetical protein